MQSPNGARRIAMFIDGENVQPALVGPALAEAAKHGTVMVRRVYSNWTVSAKSAWKAAIHASGALPIQQFAYVSGKNAVDIALVIDAMDFFHSGGFDGFCIVSSDSDYTRLAIRLREQGMFVMGIGRSDTPQSFVAACDVFVHAEKILEPDKSVLSLQATSQKPAAKVSARGIQKANQQPATDDSWVQVVRQALDKAGKNSEGWVPLTAVGTQIKQIAPEFKAKNYGYKQLGLLIKSRPTVFEMKGSHPSTYVRVIARR